MRLCQSLRIAVREMENLSHRSIGKISVKDWEGLMGQMRNILMAGGELANYIGEHFATIAFQARDTLQRLPASPPASNIR